MAKEQWRKIGVMVGMVTLAILIVGMAWAGGGRVTGVEKDIESVRGNAEEDRKAIAAVLKRTTALEVEASEARLRDERIASQFTEISAYMRTESKKTDEIIKEQKAGSTARQEIKIELTKVQSTVNNLERAE
jgi:hypothetical protein